MKPKRDGGQRIIDGLNDAIAFAQGDESRGTLHTFEVKTCSKCGARGVAFICDEKGCPVNGGAAYPWTPPHPSHGEEE